MSRWIGFFVVAIAFFVVGSVVAVLSLKLGHQEDVVRIPEGSFLQYFKIDLEAGDTLKVEFEEVDGGTIRVTLYQTKTEQFGFFQEGWPFATRLRSSSGSSGEFQYTVEDSHPYYLVFSHGSGYADIQQTVSVTVEVFGISTHMLAISLIPYAGAGILAWTGVIERRADESRRFKKAELDINTSLPERHGDAFQSRIKFTTRKNK